ncbi:MAG: type I-E CRISPR-associated protein Cas6/Cse3/CasE [Gammaproteobacteria bacterium]|nr:type I-E CRISPR-associated protein Cas6/Cse3/CasE [Gammaproteobacteria bacterium]MBU1962875.1 type I-E CRISPR-associated protein Cas6/Cse3/CasE [Gammaproteobacteria bacterium]
MIHLSKILIERARPASPYEWHQLLWKLFDAPPGSPRPFLFRVEASAPGRAEVLMQSDQPPSEGNGPVRVVGIRSFDPVFTPDQRLRFRLCANPIKSIHDAQGRTNGRGEAKSCRVPLIKEEEQLDWLARKLDGAARLDEALIQARQALHFRAPGKAAGKIVAVTFDGALTVRNGDRLRMLLREGIGPAKGFGCGLLSLARG